MAPSEDPLKQRSFSPQFSLSRAYLWGVRPALLCWAAALTGRRANGHAARGPAVSVEPRHYRRQRVPRARHDAAHHQAHEIRILVDRAFAAVDGLGADRGRSDVSRRHGAAVLDHAAGPEAALSAAHLDLAGDRAHPPPPAR